MVSTQQIKRGLGNPRLAMKPLNRLYYNDSAGFNSSGIDIFEEDWDNLIILDACRYDEFEHQCDLPGTLDHRTSRGSTSAEFIRGNFIGKTLHDTVYVSANGWYAKLEDQIGASINQFVFVERDEADGRTSHPKTVASRAKEIDTENPDKRLIVHFLQPHQPYLGPTGRKFPYYGGLMPTVRSDGVSHEDIVQAYRENVDLVLDETEGLLESFDGRTIITADHGELLGEQQRPFPIKWYGHPKGIYMDELVTVPWHIHENGTRKNIVAERPEATTSEYAISEVEQHLEDLGYKT